MVELIAFDPQYSKRPAASLEFDAFDPIPLPLMALAGVGVSVSSVYWLSFVTKEFLQLRYALDEYKSGFFEAKQFNEAEYKKIYRIILHSLKAMDKSPEKWKLDDIRAAILRSGR